MLVLEMTTSDVAGVRFACSPLNETVLSLTRAGRDVSLERLPSPQRRLLELLVSPTHYLPDYVTPLPPGPLPTIEAELEAVRATDPESVADEYRYAYSRSRMPDALERALDRPEELRERTADALLAHWRESLAPRWPQMQALLRSDVAYRAQRLTDEGLNGLFADLCPGVSWVPGELRVENGHDDVRTPDLRGQGLPLIPSLMAPKMMNTLDPGRPPSVVYPARGAGMVPAEGARGSALDALLVRARARILQGLATPTATSELAADLGLGRALVSYHLGIMHRCGLVDRRREGRSVLYSPTDLGRELRAAGEGR